MKLKRILSAFLTAMLLISLVGCTGGDNMFTIDDTVLSAKSFYANTLLTKQLGRNYYDNDSGVLWLVHSGSMVEFKINGTKLTVNMISDGGSFGENTNNARFAIYLDGERVVDHCMTKPEASFEVFNHTEAAEHTVKIIKLSEAAQSIVGIASIDAECYGVIEPTDDKELKIEFIGDSITCAYGVDDEVKEHGFSTHTEDATKSYAYKASELLGADYSLVCYSGNGIISGYSGDGSRATWGLVPEIYTKVGKTGGGEHPDISSVDWDFGSFKPDYIVINLGTNDNSYVKGDKTKEQEYIDGYVDFLKLVRKNNKDAHIICALGVMGDELFGAIEKAVEQFGDKNTSTLRFSPRTSSDPIAADWHPAEVTQERAAKELVAHIESLGK